MNNRTRHAPDLSDNFTYNFNLPEDKSIFYTMTRQQMINHYGKEKYRKISKNSVLVESKTGDLTTLPHEQLAAAYKEGTIINRSIWYQRNKSNKKNIKHVDFNSNDSFITPKEKDEITRTTNEQPLSLTQNPFSFHFYKKKNNQLIYLPNIIVGSVQEAIQINGESSQVRSVRDLLN